MKVRVTRKANFWYGCHVGEDFEVVCENKDVDSFAHKKPADGSVDWMRTWGDSYIVTVPKYNGNWGLILKTDCEPVVEYKEKEAEQEYTGKSVSYYKVFVDHPTSEGVEPYYVECNDIIEALNLSFAEGNVLKSLFRRAVARKYGITKKGYDDGLYDAEKMVFFSERVLKQEQK